MFEGICSQGVRERFSTEHQTEGRPMPCWSSHVTKKTATILWSDKIQRFSVLLRNLDSNQFSWCQLCFIYLWDQQVQGGQFYLEDHHNPSHQETQADLRDTVWHEFFLWQVENLHLRMLTISSLLLVYESNLCILEGHGDLWGQRGHGLLEDQCLRPLLISPLYPEIQEVLDSPESRKRKRRRLIFSHFNRKDRKIEDYWKQQ